MRFKVIFSNFINNLSVLLLLAFIPAAQASDYQSPRTAGLGGAGHAAPLLNDSIELNPAFGSFLPTYSMALDFAWTNPGRAYDISVLDGRSDLFQAGVEYTVRDDMSMVHVGASKAFLKRMGFGLGGKFFFGKSGSPSGRDATLALSGIVSDWFQTSFIVDNLFQTDAGIAHGLYREYILGTKF